MTRQRHNSPPHCYQVPVLIPHGNDDSGFNAERRDNYEGAIDGVLHWKSEMKAGISMFAIAFAFALTLSGCGLNSRETLRYRLTVTVDNNGSHVEGSSVFEVSLDWNRFGDTPFVMKFKGEAVTVDLGERRLLFVLLDASDGSYGSWAELLPENYLARLVSMPDRPTGSQLGRYARSSESPPWSRLDIFNAIAHLPNGTGAEIPLDGLPA